MKPLSRRTLLLGAGAILALPFLDAMRPVRARASEPVATPPILWFFFPNGVIPSHFRPAGTGTTYSLPPLLSPLAPVADRVRIVSGLHNQVALPHPDEQHQHLTGRVLTCAG